MSFFGSRDSFTIVRDEDGSVLLTDRGGLEGEVRLTSVESVYFAASDETWSTEDLEASARYGTEGDDALIEGNKFYNEISGLGGNDFLKGLSGNDQLDGGTGNDHHQGGLGDDHSYDEQGDDTYHYMLGDGSDTIDEYGGFDVLMLEEGIAPESVTTSLNGEDFVLTFSDGGDITFLYGAAAENMVDEVRFSDGTFWDSAELFARASGTSQNITMTSNQIGGASLYSFDAHHWQDSATFIPRFSMMGAELPNIP